MTYGIGRRSIAAPAVAALLTALLIALLTPAGAVAEAGAGRRPALAWPGALPAAPAPTEGCSIKTVERQGERFAIVPDGTPIRFGDFLRVRALRPRTRIFVNGRFVTTLDTGGEWSVTPGHVRLLLDSSGPVVVTLLRAAPAGTRCEGAGPTDW